ncbi:MAG: DNA mismatch repair endonuclease MutL [Dehalococcoidales bacterium]|nr:DNA mismatch repair endonuclease MutL [Dehalococcoidales bacterium]
MTIKVLDKETINQIAAGEVVERPASVVKELVENALDAGSSQIGVEIRGGGIQLIKVVDNGVGIPNSEVELAFERHATSKISSPQDLLNIGSLGFRGEALPSIGAVADVELLTCAVDEKSGICLSLEGGVVTQKKGQARTRGTTITVRNLFKRVPARLKFLKSIATESSHVANVASQYALAYPEAAFSLAVDGKETLKTSGKGKLLDAIIDVYGVATASKMMTVDSTQQSWTANRGTLDIHVSGMVGAPELGRAGRGYLSFFVNRRWVSSRILPYAVEEAYSGLLMTGRHPVAVVNITLPPDEVDVNIHPAKSEVKFHNEGEVFRSVQRAVRQALTSQMPVRQVEDVAAPYKATPSSQLEQLWGTSAESEGVGPSPKESTPSLLTSLPVLRVVGQFMSAYIVAEGPEGLYLIDQHAAHERVRFDRVRRQREQKKPEVQGLLESATLEVTPRQDAIMKSCLEKLVDFGFNIESFGDRTYLVRTVPVIAAGDDWSAMLKELLDALAGEERSKWEEKMTASIACHGAIKSGQVLSEEEMGSLVRQLEQTDNPHTCPHGRPTIIKLSAAQIEREFGRQG